MTCFSFVTMYILKLKKKKKNGRVLKLLYSMGICLHELGMTVTVSHVKPCVLGLNVTVTVEKVSKWNRMHFFL